MFRRHGLNDKTKRQVFDALFEWQQGRCFICGIHQNELATLHSQRGAVYLTLNIDHCHETGMIRGLLCGQCNYLLGCVENCGLLDFYLRPAYQYTPLSARQRSWRNWLHWSMDDWLERHMAIIVLYLQQDRWLPQRDILFHLQEHD